MHRWLRDYTTLDAHSNVWDCLLAGTWSLAVLAFTGLFFLSHICLRLLLPSSPFDSPLMAPSSFYPTNTLLTGICTKKKLSVNHLTSCRISYPSALKMPFRSQLHQLKAKRRVISLLVEHVRRTCSASVSSLPLSWRCNPRKTINRVRLGRTHSA